MCRYSLTHSFTHSLQFAYFVYLLVFIYSLRESYQRCTNTKRNKENYRKHTINEIVTVRCVNERCIRRLCRSSSPSDSVIFARSLPGAADCFKHLLFISRLLVSDITFGRFCVLCRNISADRAIACVCYLRRYKKSFIRLD